MQYDFLATTAKVRLTGEIIRVLRSDLPGYVFDIDSRKQYHMEELEFGRKNPHIFSLMDAEGCPGRYTTEDGLPF